MCIQQIATNASDSNLQSGTYYYTKCQMKPVSLYYTSRNVRQGRVGHPVRFHGMREYIDVCGGIGSGFECRCGGLFCAVHRYSDKHECSFDYRELGAQEIRRNNPVVVSQKIHKI